MWRDFAGSDTAGGANGQDFDTISQKYHTFFTVFLFKDHKKYGILYMASEFSAK